MDVYQNDWDGSHEYPISQVGPYSPNRAVYLSNVNQNWAVTLSIGEVVSSDLDASVTFTTLDESAGRVYDDYAIQNRFCLGVFNGELTLQVGQLLYTQFFTLSNMTVIGVDDCAEPVYCSATIQPLWSYPTFSVLGTLNWSTVSAASFHLPEMWLTPVDNTDEVGAMWKRSRISVLPSWVTTFNLQLVSVDYCDSTILGCVDVPPLGFADGVAFVVQNDPSGLTKVGSRCTSGFCHGYSGIQHSVGIIWNSYLVNSQGIFANGSTSTKIAYTEKDTNVDDGNWHTLRVTYEPKREKLTAWMDNTFMIMATISLDPIAWTNGTGFYGFTASTGTTYFSRQKIENVLFGFYQTIVNTSFVIEVGQVRGTLGEQGWFTIDARDSCSNPRFEGGDHWTITLIQSTFQHVAETVQDLQDGTYRVYFTIPSSFPEGNYSVKATLMGVNGIIGTILVAG